MNWNGELPHNGWGVLSLAILLLYFAQAGIGVWFYKRHSDNFKDSKADRETLKAETAAIKNQVVNGHTETNLRNDLDRVIDAVESLGDTVKDMSHDVRSLRSDLMAEEDRRRIQIGDLRDELEHRTGKRRNL